MILAGKYEILERGGSVVGSVDRARHTTSGRTVYLHRLAPGSPSEVGALRLALQYLLRRREPGLLQDVFEENNCTYLVTEDKPEHLNLLDLLGRPAPAANPLATPRPSFSAALPGQPRETRIANLNEFSPSRREPDKLDLSSSNPDEYTRLFSPYASGPENSPPPASSPGSLTEIFDSLPPPDPEQQFESSSSGEYTRLFAAESIRKTTSKDASKDLLGENPLPLPLNKPDSQSPGEFTRIIGRNALSSGEQSLKGDRAQPAATQPDLPPPLPKLAAPPAFKTTPPMPQSRLQAKGVSPVLILLFAIVIAAVAVLAFFLLRR